MPPVACHTTATGPCGTSEVVLTVGTCTTSAPGGSARSHPSSPTSISNASRAAARDPCPRVSSQTLPGDGTGGARNRGGRAFPRPRELAVVPIAHHVIRLQLAKQRQRLEHLSDPVPVD